MSVFLTDQDRCNIVDFNQNRRLSNLHWGLMGRVASLTENPGLGGRTITTDYWHHAAEDIGDAAFVGALTNNQCYKNWVRNAVLSLVRLPERAWLGPAFRPAEPPYVGALETSHLSIAVSLAFDLVFDSFQPNEIEELQTTLRERAIVLCRRYLNENPGLNNWRAVLAAGLAVAAAVLKDRESMERAAVEFELCNSLIQDDGSYGESLQYGNYCFYGLMIIYEALVRADPARYARRLTAAARYPRAVRWFIHSLMYQKPLAGWGEYPRPRSVNFNDSAAVFGANPDLLMHIAARFADWYPDEAGFARAFFDKLYGQYPFQGPFDRNSFGFVNRCGFLSYMYYSRSAPPVDLADLPLTAAFDNGNCISRSSWDNDATVLAFNASGRQMGVAAHLHNDLNSLILSHRAERMLADPGHCCYRNLIHQFDVAANSHNTCTFYLPDKNAVSAADCRRAAINAFEPEYLVQRQMPGRGCADGVPLPAVDRPGCRLIAARIDDVSCFGNDAAAAYYGPITKFERFTVLCGAHVVFVFDRIAASKPVVTVWNWVLNNRDNELVYKVAGSDRLVVRRGNCGMKLFHLNEADCINGPYYGYIHDAYHVLPDQQGEGFAGSGMIFRWNSAPSAALTALHAIVVDEYGYSSGYHLHRESPLCCAVEEFEGRSTWRFDASSGGKMEISETVSGRMYALTEDNSGWRMTKK